MTSIYSGLEEYNDGVEYYRPYGVEDYQTEHYRSAMKIAGAARKLRRFRGLGRVGAKIGGRVGSAGAISAAMARKFRGAGKMGASLARRGRSGGKKMSAAAKKLRKMRKARLAASKARKAKQAARLKKMQKLKKMRKMQKAKRARKAKTAADSTKKLGDGAKKSSRARRAFKGARNITKRNAKLLKYAAIAGAIGGGTMFLDKKYKERDKKVKECASICLPKNWDAFDQKKIKSTELQYKTLEEVKAAGAVDDQPVCSKDIGGGKCESHCMTKCEEITKLDLGAPLNAVTGAAGKVAKAGLNVAGKVTKAGMNVAGKILGPIWKKIKMPFMIILVLIILSVVAKFMPKGRPRAPPPAVY
tara:strand:+ start:3624 stop:4700 length:1077 start_codon:yes stop_codon:yes gene_type:complete